MSSEEAREIVAKMLALFPTLDKTGCVELHGRLLKFGRDNARKAVDEYLTLGKTFFESGQYLAILYRFERQEAERDSTVSKARSKFAEEQERLAMNADLARADAMIAEMTDQDVMDEWAPILATIPGKPHEWASRWSAATVRTVQRFRLKIAALTKVRSA